MKKMKEMLFSRCLTAGKVGIPKRRQINDNNTSKRCEKKTNNIE